MGSARRAWAHRNTLRLRPRPVRMLRRPVPHCPCRTRREALAEAPDPPRRHSWKPWFWRTTMANKPTILIVGASRGLGLALVEQFCSRDWHVIATVRRKSPALDALKARFPASLEEETADIADEASVRTLRQRLDGRTIDMLFVNAGIAKSITATPGTAPVQDFLDMMLVNAFSPVADRDLRGYRRAERHDRSHVLRTGQHYQQRRPLGSLR